MAAFPISNLVFKWMYLKCYRTDMKWSIVWKCKYRLIIVIYFDLVLNIYILFEAPYDGLERVFNLSRTSIALAAFNYAVY